MDKGATIITKYNNQKLGLLFSETFLLYKRETEVAITLPSLNWTFKLIFGKDVPEMNPLGSKTKVIGLNVEITYNNWFGVVQNQGLQLIESAKKEIQLYHALKTVANIKDDIREVTFYIWQVIP